MESVEYQTSHCTGGGGVVSYSSIQEHKKATVAPADADSGGRKRLHVRSQTHKTSEILAIGSAGNKLPTHSRVL